MTTQNKVLLGILGAAAAGVVIGLLIAPEKGKDMRKKISKTARDWSDNLSHLWSKSKEAAEEAAENAGDDLKEKAKRARSTAQEAHV